jgi:hypothetical protein
MKESSIREVLPNTKGQNFGELYDIMGHHIGIQERSWHKIVLKDAQ